MKTIKIPFTNKVIVDKKELMSIEYKKDLSALSLNIFFGKVEYTYREIFGAYCVDVIDGDIFFPIKIFKFGDDKQYAKLCAEELCEMLNSKM